MSSRRIRFTGFCRISQLLHSRTLTLIRYDMTPRLLFTLSRLLTCLCCNTNSRTR